MANFALALRSEKFQANEVHGIRSQVHIYLATQNMYQHNISQVKTCTNYIMNLMSQHPGYFKISEFNQIKSMRYEGKLKLTPQKKWHLTCFVN